MSVCLTICLFSASLILFSSSSFWIFLSLSLCLFFMDSLFINCLSLNITNVECSYKNLTACPRSLAHFWIGNREYTSQIDRTCWTYSNVLNSYSVQRRSLVQVIHSKLTISNGQDFLNTQFVGGITQTYRYLSRAVFFANMTQVIQFQNLCMQSKGSRKKVIFLVRP